MRFDLNVHIFSSSVPGHRPDHRVVAEVADQAVQGHEVLLRDHQLRNEEVRPVQLRMLHRFGSQGLIPVQDLRASRLEGDHHHRLRFPKFTLES